VLSCWVDENTSYAIPLLRLGSIKKQIPDLRDEIWHPFVPIYFQDLALKGFGLGMETLFRFVAWFN